MGQDPPRDTFRYYIYSSEELVSILECDLTKKGNLPKTARDELVKAIHMRRIVKVENVLDPETELDYQI